MDRNAGADISEECDGIGGVEIELKEVWQGPEQI